MNQQRIIELKAWIATGVFAIVGIVGAYLAPSVGVALPHLLFYTVLTYNTFFSVRLFVRIEPHTFEQMLIDAALTIAYILLGLSIGHAWSFAFCALGIFGIAPLKYTRMLDVVPHTRFLRKKITIDLLGTLLCITIIGLTIAGYPLLAAWMLAGIFALANVYFLGINPMYRL